jgi:hypothetical protein
MITNSHRQTMQFNPAGSLEPRSEAGAGLAGPVFQAQATGPGAWARPGSEARPGGIRIESEASSPAVTEWHWQYRLAPQSSWRPS